MSIRCRDNQSINQSINCCDCVSLRDETILRLVTLQPRSARRLPTIGGTRGIYTILEHHQETLLPYRWFLRCNERIKSVRFPPNGAFCPPSLAFAYDTDVSMHVFRKKKRKKKPHPPQKEKVLRRGLRHIILHNVPPTLYTTTSTAYRLHLAIFLYFAFMITRKNKIQRKIVKKCSVFLRLRPCLSLYKATTSAHGRWR